MEANCIQNPLHAPATEAASLERWIRPPSGRAPCPFTGLRRAQFYAEIADYLVDVYRHVGERYADMVPVLIWFAWSDWMRNAGIVDKNGNRQDHLYAAYRKVRNRELWA